MSDREVVIVSGVRTAIGDYGGSLKDMPPTELGAKVIREAIRRAGVDVKSIGQCVIGNVIHTEPRDMYISRVAAVNGGLPVEYGRADGQSPVRQRPAGHRQRLAVHPARRHRRRSGRRRGKHEPRRRT